jgi:hypothetical protein
MPKTNVVPAEYLDLFTRPVVVSLATVNADGQPQVTPVWCDYDGEFIRVNSADGRQKVKNMRERPLVTVLAIDPDDPYRWVEVRGTVEQIDDDPEHGVEHINSLSARYRGVQDYYSRNERMRGREHRLIFRIRPTHFTGSGHR